MKEFDYKKSLGQNFLIDNNIINKIVSNINPNIDDLIIEIGPGAGALTKEISKIDCESYSFEIDKSLKNKLDLIENNKTHIIYEDFLNVDLKNFLSKIKYNKLYFIGNIPYYITTPIIKKITEETDADSIKIMIQKEVANRFLSLPGNREYGSISVYLQYNYDIKKIVDVNKKSFYPVPNVDSIVIKLDTREKEKLKNKEHFNNLIRDAFQYKRKTLKNNLSKYDLKVIERVLNNSNKNLSFRAEQLTVKDFVDISNELN